MGIFPRKRNSEQIIPKAVEFVWSFIGRTYTTLRAVSRREKYFVDWSQCEAFYFIYFINSELSVRSPFPDRRLGISKYAIHTLFFDYHISA
jgi:hypothetical protein